MRFLADVNVLVALAFPAHPSHRSAQAWLSKEPNRPWATCALTQAGFLRVCYAQLGRTRAALSLALAGLEQTCSSPDHDYWPVDIDLRDLTVSQRGRLIGHNQLADMQLLMLAHRHAGQLVTFDTGLRVLAVGTRFANSLLVR